MDVVGCFYGFLQSQFCGGPKLEKLGSPLQYKTLDFQEHISNRPAPYKPDSSCGYEVKNEENRSVGIDILYLFYGNLWQLAMDNLKHQVDGYISTIRHNGQKFRVYRKLNTQTVNYPKLRLIVKT